MAQAADYRKRAEECVEMAQTARTGSQRTMLLHIADTWMRLANESEDRVVSKAAPHKPRPATAM